MTMGKKIGLKETADCLKNADSVIITAHVSPDGDAIGATLGWAEFLSGCRN